jgi:hypothetical protein
MLIIQDYYFSTTLKMQTHGVTILNQPERKYLPTSGVD